MPKNKVISIGESVNKRKKRRSSLHQLMFILIITLSLIFVLTAPVFAIKTINIEGNSYFSDDDIKSIIGIDNQTNIFYFIFENTLYDDNSLSPYINNLSIDIDFPNEVSILVDERQIVGYVPYLGTYLCIDKDGRVIDTSLFINEQVPIIEGFDLNGFSLNTILDTNNQDLYSDLVYLISNLVKYDLLDEIIKIDISNIENIKLCTRNIEIVFGSPRKINEKVDVISQIIEEVGGMRGILDIGERDQKFPFKKS